MRKSCLTRSLSWFLTALLFAGLSVSTIAEQVSDEQLNTRFTQSVAPLLRTYCLDCHGHDEPEAKLDLTVYRSLGDITSAYPTWEIVLERLAAGEMPPEEADRKPTDVERRELVSWIQAVRQQLAARNAGDPGPVPARRLSNAEYNYTIRDLTGVDIQPTATFPVDPANEAGFDNSAESLTMSPALVSKYLGAARQVVEHLVLTPRGIRFAPHPVVTDTDRDKYCVHRIVEFYQRQPTDLADYFLACWRFQHRDALDASHLELPDIAASSRVSPKYLNTVWHALNESSTVGPLAKLQSLFRELPERDEAAARAGCEAMRDFVVTLRNKLKPSFEFLNGSGVAKGSQAVVLFRNRQYAAHRMQFDGNALQVEGATPEAEVEDDLLISADESERAKQVAEFAELCRIFPDAFYISERGREYVDQPNPDVEKGRLLSAGFHSMMGYFRDDAPLCELILSETEQRQLDALWQELDFVTAAPMRQYSGYIWFERAESGFLRDAEFDFARSEDKSAWSEAMIQRLSEAYLTKLVRRGGSDLLVQAVREHFQIINEQVRWVERARIEAEPSHLDAVLEFAERAYRRPLSDRERLELFAFYQTLRDESGLGHEEAIQDTLVSVLMSPHFCFRVDLGSTGEGTRPLTDYELASRLSYFLWSSMPDAELLEVAAAGELRQPDMLLSQTRRMLRDPRVRGLAVEFAGNWLDIRRFEEHNSVDRDRFPSFTNELRLAMFEEPIRFFMDVVQRDRSILDFLYADDTFVNQQLAKHYGIELEPGLAPDWTRIDDAARLGRGGLLPMSVFLTKNSPGLRTSPVKRGYWVVRRLLGERIPPPPPGVPELPNDESKLGELTLPEMLAKHRAHKSCAGCHDRFDSIGLVFEGYGPIGEFRERDLGGRPVNTTATFPGDAGEGQGIAGLRRYLREHREADFVSNLSRKLLSYGLGRTLLPSDDDLLNTLDRGLASEHYRFASMIESIVVSPQFVNKRGSETLLGNVQ